MNTEKDMEEPAENGSEIASAEDAGCDPKHIDDLQCRMMGIAKQAEYNGPFTVLLDKAKMDYDLTRKDYRQKRHDAQLKVQDLQHAVKQLTERIRCKIEQERVVRNLDKAFVQVVDQLTKCQPEIGCCCSEADCHFDLDCQGLPYDELVKRIDKYQARTDAAQQCFTTLVGEPAALELRVAARKDDVDKINAVLLEDPATTDLKMVYAQALVAERDVNRVWNGFGDVNEFVECLCCALKCWTNGGGAVSKLLGTKAVRDCRRKAEQDHCARLQSNTVDEIIVIYDKLCADERPCDADGERHGHQEGHEGRDSREEREEHEEREEREERREEREEREERREEREEREERREEREEREERREGRERNGGQSWYDRHGGREG
ncbi:hypothetical protein [Paenarthrobacter sp. PH39-S1]|uniref:hypothetical protein n=1 Tax=Paenarthrobacter sp. PH39-S1 TaxID=3046204 RepID=UPI0024B97312|nr:hypothetical protein [Paenarthrobacter sp. PH39-S1]MDJ0355307.1 hypothetical protein [Paenarthrobacter sp. PH39-S1]